MKQEPPKPTLCATCGTPCENTARFCPQCGRPVTARNEEHTDDTPTATDYNDLRVVGGEPPVTTAPAPKPSFWSSAWPKARRWIVAAALAATLLGLLLPFYHIPDVAAPLRAPGMVIAVLSGIDLAPVDEARPANQAAALALETASSDSESMAVQGFLVWLALGPVWLLACALLVAMPLLRDDTPGKAGFSLTLLWLAGAWPVVWLLGARLGQWADLFHMAGAGFWCAFGAMCLLELARRFS